MRQILQQMPKLLNFVEMTDDNQSICLSAKSSVAMQDLEDLQTYRSEGVVKHMRSPQATSKKISCACTSMAWLPDHLHPALLSSLEASVDIRNRTSMMVFKQF